MSNPRGPQESVDWAISQIGNQKLLGRKGLCDHFVGLCCGYAHSGFPTAYLHWVASPEKHRKDYNAPLGALVFWAPNHVALSIGGGECVTSDWPTLNGVIGRVGIRELTKAWNMDYLGWTPPYFGSQGSGNVVEGSDGYTPQQADTPTTNDPATPNDWQSSAAEAVSFLGAKANWQRIGIGAAGALLLVIAVWLMSSGAATQLVTETLADG